MSKFGDSVGTTTGCAFGVMLVLAALTFTTCLALGIVGCGAKKVHNRVQETRTSQR